MKKSLFYTLFFACFFSIISAQSNSKRMFVFGHSLIDHRPPLIATPSDETTVPHWMYLLAQASENDFAAGGQYGFLPQHANLPPIAQWGYDSVPGVWESDYEPFSAADINTILLTAGNFMQWQAPSMEYPSDPGITPVSATETVFDWVALQEDSVRYYIYENWPDMAPYLSAGFPPSANEFSTYNAFTINEFHDWWLEYHDALLASRPNLKVRMIPVGPIISRLMITVLSNQIPLTELYEDDAPHGRASLYFLASLATYMAVYEAKAPADFPIPSIIHPNIATNYADIVDFIWTELQAFNLPNGDSRVFFNTTTSNEESLTVEAIHAYPNPTADFLFLEKTQNIQKLYITDMYGRTRMTFTDKEATNARLDVRLLPTGVYFLNVDTHIFRFIKL